MNLAIEALDELPILDKINTILEVLYTYFASYPRNTLNASSQLRSWIPNVTVIKKQLVI
jgi:hypothetical protein